MTWVRFDDCFTEHPKVVGLPGNAFRLHVAAICYSARNLTDGRVPSGALATLRGTPSQAGILVAAGLWEECDDGWRVHDYLEYNPSADSVKQQRAEAKDRMRKMRSPDVRPNNKRSSPEVREPRTRSPTRPLITSPTDQQVDPTETVSPLTAAACQATFFEGTNPVAALVDMAVQVEGVDRKHVDGGGLGGVIKKHGRGKDVWEALRAYTANRAVGQLHEYMMKVLKDGQRRNTAGYGQAGGGTGKNQGRAGEGNVPQRILTADEVKQFSAKRRAEKQGVQAAGDRRGHGAGQAVPGPVPGQEDAGVPAEQPGGDD